MENLGQNLLRFTYKNKTFCVADTETEGLNARYSRPWSIAWITSKGDEIIDVQDRYLWWNNLEVSKGAAMRTGFDYLVYKEKAEDPKKVFEEYEPILYNKNTINVYHNGIGLDCYMIDSWRRGIGLKSDYSFLNHYIDTNCIEKAAKLSLTPQYPLLEWMYKLDSVIKKGLKTNLTLLCKEYEIEVDESKFHGALYDVEQTRKILFKQFNRIELEDRFN